MNFAFLLTTAAVAAALLLLLCDSADAKRNWEYEPLTVYANSSDESKLKLDMKVERISRGEFAISGTVMWEYDVNDETTVEVIAYRSSTGNDDDYKLLPWSMPKDTFYNFLNDPYKDVIIPNLGHCSNLPQFEGEFVPPWPRTTYVFDKCVLTGEKLPEVAPEGYYKIIASITGEVDWTFTAIAKLTTKMY